jgi:hypothetical protein
VAHRTSLKITRVTVEEGGTIKVDRRRESTFAAMLNPSSFKHERAITYNGQRTLGQLGSDMKFDAIGPDRINLSLVLDGTGAVPALPKEPAKDVSDMLADLSRVVYNFDGTHHQPSHVRLLWGALILFGRMEKMSTDYTLFRPSGEPLRASVTLGFVGFTSNKLSALTANRTSPDLSHLIEVRQGDTLPLLCHRVYGDASYYPEVARINELTDFRRLEPGAKLHFPPLV